MNNRLNNRLTSMSFFFADARATVRIFSQRHSHGHATDVSAFGKAIGDTGLHGCAGGELKGVPCVPTDPDAESHIGVAS